MNEIEQNTEEQMAAMRQAILEVSELYHITFGTPAGKKVLEHMDNMTRGSSLNQNDFMDSNAGVSASEFMFIREGQDQVIRFIKKMIQFYKEQK